MKAVTCDSVYPFFAMTCQLASVMRLRCSMLVHACINQSVKVSVRILSFPLVSHRSQQCPELSSCGGLDWIVPKPPAGNHKEAFRTMACMHLSQRAATSLAGGCSTNNRVESLTNQTPYDFWTPSRLTNYALRSQRQAPSQANRRLKRYSQLCLRNPLDKRSCTSLPALPADDEEAQLTADYDALNERLEVRCILLARSGAVSAVYTSGQFCTVHRA